ncbi:MAG: porin [Pirellulaceae bacterium]|nr:porin [Pirellulaceae bacterium]
MDRYGCSRALLILLFSTFVSSHSISSELGFSGEFDDSPAETMTVSKTSFDHLLRRLDELEATVLEDKVAEEACQEVKIISKPTQKWFGRLHLDYWGFPNESPLANELETGDPNTQPGDFIGFRRLRFGVSGKVNETMRYKIEMEWAVPSEPTMKDAFFGWTELPFLQTVLLGNQKRPYGLDTLNSSRYNVFMERPFVVEAYNQDARRIGLQSYGVSENERWNWRYGTFLMDDLQGLGHQRTNNYQPEVAARLANTIWYDEVSGGRGYAHWAISGAACFPGGGDDGRFRTRPEARSKNRWLDTGNFNANSYQLCGLEGVGNFGSLSVVGEYMFSQAQRFNQADVNFGGGYVYVAYWLTGEYTPWDRRTGCIGRTKPLENFFLVRNCDGGCSCGWGAWQIAGRYSYGDYTDENVLGGIGESFTFGLNWWWNPNARMQFNYLNGQISDRLVAGDAGDYNIFGARFMVDF